MFDQNPLVLMDTGLVFFDTGSAAAGGLRKGTMIQLALKLTRLTIAALKSLAVDIKTGLTGNASFPTPNPTPAQLQAGVDAVTAQEAALSAAEAQVDEEREMLDQKRVALEDLIRAAGLNCLDKVKMDAEDVAKAKLLSANLPLAEDPAPVAEVDTPQNFSISHGDHSGEVDGGCNRVANAKMYRVRHSATPNGPWTTVSEGTRSSFTAKNVALGDGWFQMAAFGTNGGWSEWSDIARLTVV